MIDEPEVDPETNKQSDINKIEFKFKDKPKSTPQFNFNQHFSPMNKPDTNIIVLFQTDK